MVRRRRFLSGSVAAGVLGLSGCLELRSRDAELDGEWRQVGRDSTNTNHSPRVTLPDSFDEQWRRRIGSQPYVPPVVVDGSVAAVDAVVVAGGSRGLFAFDPDDGTEFWHRELDGYVTDGAAVTGETVLVPEHREEGPHRLRAFGLADGSDRWAVPLERRPFAPTARDGRLYLRTADECLEVGEREVQWRTELDELGYEEYRARDPRLFAATIKPAVTRDRVVIPDHHALVALDPANGREQWRENLHAINASPVVTDDLFVALGLDDVVAFERDGTERWRVAEGRWGSLAVADDEVYVLGANELVALDRKDGEHLWDTLVTGDVVRSPPAVLGDAVLTVVTDGVAFRRDPGFFQDRQLLRLEGRTTGFRDHGSAVVGAGRAFAIDGRHGNLVAFGPKA